MKQLPSSLVIIITEREARQVIESQCCFCIIHCNMGLGYVQKNLSKSYSWGGQGLQRAGYILVQSSIWSRELQNARLPELCAGPARERTAEQGTYNRTVGPTGQVHWARQ